MSSFTMNKILEGVFLLVCLSWGFANCRTQYLCCDCVNITTVLAFRDSTSLQFIHVALQ